MPLSTILSGNAHHDLIGLINEQEEHAFNILYRKYWPSLLDFAGTIIKDNDTCQEIVQQLFIQLYIKRPKLCNSAALPAYLRRSLRNRILNYLRDTSRYHKHIQTAYNRALRAGNDGRNNNIDQFVGFSELRSSIAHALKEMPIKYREVYELHEHRQLTLKKTAHVLNRPLETVEKQYRKAIQLLRIHLEQHEISLAGFYYS